MKFQPMISRIIWFLFSLTLSIMLFWCYFKLYQNEYTKHSYRNLALVPLLSHDMARGEKLERTNLSIRLIINRDSSYFPPTTNSILGKYVVADLTYDTIIRRTMLADTIIESVSKQDYIVPIKADKVYGKSVRKGQLIKLDIFNNLYPKNKSIRVIEVKMNEEYCIILGSIPKVDYDPKMLSYHIDSLAVPVIIQEK